MERVTKETVVADDNRDVVNVIADPQGPDATPYQTVEYLIYFVFGALEILLAFRLILKMTGANPVSEFVAFIYNLSSVFVMPFQGIFHAGVTQGLETAAVFEPSTLVAIAVYSVLAWGLVKLLRVMSGKQQPAE